MLNSEVLVLNSGFVPLRITGVRDAISLLVGNKAYPVIEEDTYVKSPKLIVRVPSVIALLEYGEFPKRKVAFSKMNVIYRDDMICQFCHEQKSMKDLTVDHIIPRSRWTKSESPTNWLNLVCACKKCNSLKGSKLLKELGWKLLKNPVEPVYLPHLVISYKKAEAKGWLDFCKVNVRLVQML
jgi:5-methylcytosine-specific restriction endonuclease McrA